MTLDEEILDAAKAMRSETLSQDEEKVLGTMCQAATFELLARLRPEVSFEYVHDNFVRAAAALATAMYLETKVTTLAGYTAGSVKAENRTPRQMKEAAASLRNQAELMLMGFITDRRFDFRAVRG